MSQLRKFPRVMSLIQGIVRKLGYRRCLFFVFVSILATVALYGTAYPNIREMLELEKCPACYGVSLCSDILESPVKVKLFHFHNFALFIFYVCIYFMEI